MKILGYELKKIEKRQIPGEPTEWIPFNNDWPPPQGVRLASVNRCLRLYSDFLSEIPLISEPEGHYLTALLDQPNSFQSQRNFYETLCFELLLYGNFFCKLRYESTGRITALLPYRQGGIFCYAKRGEYADPISIEDGGFFFRDFKGRVFLPGEIWHLKDSMFSNSDLLNGISRVYLHSLAFQSGYALANAENSISSSNLRPPWLLTGLPESDSEEVKATRNNITTFLRQGGKGVLTMPEGYDLKSLQLHNPGPVLQYLASKSDLDICRIFGVPIELISRSDGQQKGSASDLKESHRFFLKSSVKSFLKNISDGLGRLAGDGTKFHYEIDRFRSSDLREVGQFLQQMVASEVLTKEEAKKML